MSWKLPCDGKVYRVTILSVPVKIATEFGECYACDVVIPGGGVDTLFIPESKSLFVASLTAAVEKGDGTCGMRRMQVAGEKFHRWYAWPIAAEGEISGKDKAAGKTLEKDGEDLPF